MHKTQQAVQQAAAQVLAHFSGVSSTASATHPPTPATLPWATPASPRLHSCDQFGCSQLQHHNLAVLGVPASLPPPSPAPWPHGGCPGCSSTSGVSCTPTHFPTSPPARPLQWLYPLHPCQVCNSSDCWCMPWIWGTIRGSPSLGSLKRGMCPHSPSGQGVLGCMPTTSLPTNL